MTETQTARQVGALPQDAQRLVLDLIAALKPKSPPAAQSPRKRPSVCEKYAGTVSGPSDLSTNKAYRRAWGDLAEQRLDELKSGKVTPVPGPEVLRRVRNRNR